MHGLGLFLVSVAVFAGVPLLILARRTSFTLLLLHTHLATSYVLAIFLAPLYEIRLFDQVTLTAGQVAYGGFVFTILLLVIVGRDEQVLRNVIAVTLVVVLVVFVVYAVGSAALHDPQVHNPLQVPGEVLHRSLRRAVASGVLIVVELVLLVGLLEAAKHRLPSGAMPVVFPLVFLATLALDAVLYPLAVLAPVPDLGRLVWLGLQAKLVLAGAFAVPLLGFVLVARRAMARYEQRELQLRRLVSFSPDDLLERLDRQQAALDAQRQRLTESTHHAGRATATVDRILDAATNTILVALDQDLRITHFNSGAQRMLGYTREEVLGSLPTMFHTREELERLAREMGVAGDAAEMVRAWVDSGIRRDIEYRGRDGEVFTASLGLTEIVVDDEIVGYLAVGEDVTSRVRAEQAMLGALRREHDAELRLQQADRVKNELVSTVSHELRTPIAGINGYVELLADGDLGKLNDAQRDALGRVLRNTRRLKQLVDDLLLLEQAGLEALALQSQRLDLREIVGDVTAEPLTEMLLGRDLAVGVDVPDEPVWVEGDPGGLERMAMHLLSNAVKFTPGSGRVTIRVRTHQGRAELSIADTGIGISAADQERLFVQFFRTAEADRLAIQGSGLGLPIVHSIVLGHGGEIAVVSAPGAGTTVTVSLPRAG